MNSSITSGFNTELLELISFNRSKLHQVQISSIDNCILNIWEETGDSNGISLKCEYLK